MKLIHPYYFSTIFISSNIIPHYLLLFHFFIISLLNLIIHYSFILFHPFLSSIFYIYNYIQIIEEKMGECFSSTLLHKYNPYFQQLPLGHLTDLWSTLQLSKIKQIYKQHALNTHQLNFTSFKQILPGLSIYSQIQIKKIFSIFDKDQKGSLSLTNLISGLSICKFGPDKILYIFMFMLYDQHISKSLKKFQLKRLLEQNKQFFNNKQLNYETIFGLFAGGKQEISVDEFVRKLPEILQFEIGEYRSIFNIFEQERQEKKLAQEFNRLNKIYNQEQRRYVGYIVSRKWFQSWKYYISQHFNIDINNINSKIKNKTKQNSLKLINDKKIYDFIHDNIGQKPRNLNNTFIQGDYQGTLKSKINHNQYLLVSQIVWNQLNNLYSGGPCFRRTGIQSIQMYPKILKIYSGLFKGKIDYSLEVSRQVPSILSLFEILTESLQIKQQDLLEMIVYFKVIRNKNWIKIEDLKCPLNELHTQNIIFILYLNKQQNKQFIQNTQKFHLGDEVQIQVDRKNIEKSIFMGQNPQGKYIFHFQNMGFANDICLTQTQMKNNIKISQVNRPSINIPNKYLTSYGFQGALLNLFLHINQFLGYLKNIKNSDPNLLITHLSILSKNPFSNPRKILQIMDNYKKQKKEQQQSQNSHKIAQLFLKQIQNQSLNNQRSNSLTKYFQFQQRIIGKCNQCGKQQKKQIKKYSLNLKIKQELIDYYTVIFVPYSKNLKAVPIKKYGFTLPKHSSFTQYKNKFKQVSNILTDDIIFLEIYRNDIIKNYSNIKMNETLENIGLKQQDQIYAFQILVDYQQFIKTHYKIEQQQIVDFTTNMFVDCNNQEKGWLFGKICSIQYLTYTRRTVVNVIHKVNRDQQWKISYDNFQLAKFPTQSFKKSQQFLIRLNQREFNQSHNSMQKIGNPLVITLAQWMRWRELYFLVYLQMKKFINQQQQQYDMVQNDWKNFNLKSQKCINNKKSAKSVENKIKNFKNYIHSQNFPYKLNIVDYEGRCSICYRFVKSMVYKGESDKYCTGCEFSQTDPISWQVKCTDLFLCVDWKYGNKRKDMFIQEDISYKKMIQQEKSSVILKECIMDYLRECKDEIEECECKKMNISREIVKYPNLLLIDIDRQLRQEDYTKRINSAILYQVENLNINEKMYNLKAVLKQNENSNDYSAFILQQNNWNQYCRQGIKKIQNTQILNSRAHILLYSKK